MSLSGSVRIGRLAVLLMPLSACAPDPARDAGTTERGMTLFVQECAQCHGADGRGGGPASLGLGMPPPSLTGLSRQNLGLFPRDAVAAVIIGAGRGEHPTAAMPEFGATGFGARNNGAEGGKPPIRTSELAALIDYLESIQEP